LICIVAGTRPEFIKLAPVLIELQKRNIGHQFIATGQHYDKFMKDIFLDEFHLKPDINLGVHNSNLSKLCMMLQYPIKNINPDVVVVQGDTNSALAGALVAFNNNIKVGHIEAGYMSYDWDMTEEKSRGIIDTIADYAYAPTETAKMNLHIKRAYGYSNQGQKIILTGNTIIDAIQLIDVIQPTFKNVDALLTLVRPENTTLKALQKIMKAMEKTGLKKILWHIHPRFRNFVKDLEIPHNIELREPVTYGQILGELQNVEYLFTDSGGMLEEAYYFDIKCIQIRKSTERPEAMGYNAALSHGNEVTQILDAWARLKLPKINWQGENNVFGNGTAGKKIVDHLESVIL